MADARCTFLQLAAGTVLSSLPLAKGGLLWNMAVFGSIPTRSVRAWFSKEGQQRQQKSSADIDIPITFALLRSLLLLQSNVSPVQLSPLYRFCPMALDPSRALKWLWLYKEHWNQSTRALHCSGWNTTRALHPNTTWSSPILSKKCAKWSFIRFLPVWREVARNFERIWFLLGTEISLVHIHWIGSLVVNMSSSRKSLLNAFFFEDNVLNVIQWLQHNKLLPRVVTCATCNFDMQLVKRQSRLDSFVWYAFSFIINISWSWCTSFIHRSFHCICMTSTNLYFHVKITIKYYY